MLDPTLDLEADLGIDSIKRVEILNSFRKILPVAKQRELEGGIEALAGTKTLQGIMDWIRNEPANLADSAASAESNKSLADNNNGHSNGSSNEEKSSLLKRLEATQKPNATQENSASIESSISRALVHLVPLAPATVSRREIGQGVWLLVDDADGVAEKLSQALVADNRKVVRIQHSVGKAGQSEFSADLTDQAQLKPS